MGSGDTSHGAERATGYSKSPEANAAVKRLLLETFNNGFETQMELEGRTIAHCADSDDGLEGIVAFIEKRQPDFN